MTTRNISNSQSSSFESQQSTPRSTFYNSYKSHSVPELGDNIRVATQRNNYEEEQKKSTKHSKFELPIIYPDDKLKILWDIFLILVLLYSCVEIPITVAFQEPLTLDTAIGIIAFSVDLFLLVDVAINLRTAIFDNHDHLQIIAKPSEIARMYKYHFNKNGVIKT